MITALFYLGSKCSNGLISSHFEQELVKVNCSEQVDFLNLKKSLQNKGSTY